MAEFDDLRLDKPTALSSAPERRRWPVIAAAVLVTALAATWSYLRQRSAVDQASLTATEQAVAPAASGTSSAKIDLPPLGESDALVRQLVGALSAHPVLAAWLTTDQLIRNFTVSVMNVADGEAPSGHLSVIKPDTRFQVVRKHGRTCIDPRSYSRFDGHAAAIAGLDPAGAARLYLTLKPRIEEAYRELAGVDASFDRALTAAIAELLRTPIVEGDVALEPRTAGYAYADPSLESRSRAQQQLLRMGPDNVRQVQEKLRAIAQELGIHEASLVPR
jgi:hypothetical protein